LARCGRRSELEIAFEDLHAHSGALPTGQSYDHVRDGALALSQGKPLLFEQDRSYSASYRSFSALQAALAKARAFHQDPSETLFSLALIQTLHETLADGPTSYRRQPRTVPAMHVTEAGEKHACPGPAEIQAAMALLLRDSNALSMACLNSPERCFEVAAKISHGFLSIQPYDDRNGQVARLLAVMALIGLDCPLPVPFYSDPDQRQRYGLSLLKGDGGNLTPLTHLLVHRFLDLMDQVEADLQQAGFPAIIPPEELP
jgi:Fic/DOC family